MTADFTRPDVTPYWPVCTNCNHGPDDHIDRAFGYPRCAPAIPAGESPAGLRVPRTKRCECPGYAREAS